MTIWTHQLSLDGGVDAVGGDLHQALHAEPLALGSMMRNHDHNTCTSHASDTIASAQSLANVAYPPVESHRARVTSFRGGPEAVKHGDQLCGERRHRHGSSGVELAQVRGRQLACARQVLGIHEPIRKEAA
jgi:hypothetical protein